MSLKDYLKDHLAVVVNGIKNGDKVIESFMVEAMVANGTIEPEALAEIRHRIDICKSCPMNSVNRPDHKTTLDYQHCILCLCPVGQDNARSKEYSLSSNCGAKGWNERNPKLPPHPVRWEAFSLTKP